MIASRTRARVLLVATFLAGCAVGGFAFASFGRSTARRPGFPGLISRPQQQDWMRAFKLDSVHVDTVNLIRRHSGRIIDSVTRSRIGVQLDSLQSSIDPALDSLYGTIRATLDSIRTQSRVATRAALPESLRVRYDSVVAAADSSRRRLAEQRTSGRGRGGSPGRSGVGSSSGRARGGSGRSGGGPPGGGSGSF